MDRSSPELVLLPTLLDAEYGAEQVSAALQGRMLRLHHLVVESEREARRMIRRILPKVDINQYHLYLLNEHSNASELMPLLAPMEQGHDLGLMSDAGCPALADPGSALVMEVHRRGWKVVPYSGPSSIMLAWMSSGLNGQHMEFHGYLPVKNPALDAKIRDLEAQSRRCTSITKAEPGSAKAGQPASDINPRSCPCSMGANKGISSDALLCSFKRYNRN
ncbi:MAG: SAM-dependent methyltransferase [Bacteroidota bacterium]